MKVIALNGSPHQNGSTYTSLKLVCAELEAHGIGTDIIQAGLQAVRGCTACYKCRELKRCVFDDDAVNATAAKLKEADGLILSSPVYYAAIAGTMKSFLDRLFFSGPDLRYKVGAAIVSLRRSGGVTTFQQLNNYLNLKQMIIVPSLYWNVIHGTNAEEPLKDAEGVQIMQTLGRNMAWLLKTVAAGRDGVAVPEMGERVRTNFVR